MGCTRMQVPQQAGHQNQMRSNVNSRRTSSFIASSSRPEKEKPTNAAPAVTGPTTSINRNRVTANVAPVQAQGRDLNTATYQHAAPALAAPTAATAVKLSTAVATVVPSDIARNDSPAAVAVVASGSRAAVTAGGTMRRSSGPQPSTQWDPQHHHQQCYVQQQEHQQQPPPQQQSMPSHEGTLTHGYKQDMRLGTSPTGQRQGAASTAHAPLGAETHGSAAYTTADISGAANLRRQKLEALKARRARASPAAAASPAAVVPGPMIAASAIAGDLVSMVSYAEEHQRAVRDPAWSRSTSLSPAKSPPPHHQHQHYHGQVPRGRRSPSPPPPPGYGSPPRDARRGGGNGGVGSAATAAASAGGMRPAAVAKMRSPDNGTQTDPSDLDMSSLQQRQRAHYQQHHQQQQQQQHQQVLVDELRPAGRLSAGKSPPGADGAGAGVWAAAASADDTRDLADQSQQQRQQQSPHVTRPASSRRQHAASRDSSATATVLVSKSAVGAAEAGPESSARRHSGDNSSQQRRDQNHSGRPADDKLLPRQQPEQPQQQFPQRDSEGNNRRIRMAEMVRRFREEPVTVLAEDEEEEEEDEEEEGEGAEMPGAGDRVMKGEGGSSDGAVDGDADQDQDQDHPVDDLAAAVLQRSRAMLRERDAIQQRIEAALSKFGVASGAGGPSGAGLLQPQPQPQPQQQPQQDLRSGLSAAAPVRDHPHKEGEGPRGSSPRPDLDLDLGLGKDRKSTAGRSFGKGFGENEGVGRPGYNGGSRRHHHRHHPDDGDNGEDRYMGESQMEGGGAAVDGCVQGFRSDAALWHQRVGSGSGGLGGAGGGHGSGSSSSNSCTGSESSGEVPRALLAQAGVDPAPAAAPASPSITMAGGVGGSGPSLASLSPTTSSPLPPPGSSPRPGLLLKRGEAVPNDPLQAWRQLRQQQQQRSPVGFLPDLSAMAMSSVANGPATGSPSASAAAAIGAHGGGGAQQELVVRFDGTLGTHLPGGFSAARTALADWLGQVSGAAAAAVVAGRCVGSGGRDSGLPGGSDEPPRSGAVASGLRAAVTAAPGALAGAASGFLGLSGAGGGASGHSWGAGMAAVGPSFTASASAAATDPLVPSVDDLLARLAQRFGLVPGTASLPSSSKTAFGSVAGTSPASASAAQSLGAVLAPAAADAVHALAAAATIASPAPPMTSPDAAVILHSCVVSTAAATSGAAAPSATSAAAFRAAGGDMDKDEASCSSSTTGVRRAAAHQTNGGTASSRLYGPCEPLQVPPPLPPRDADADAGPCGEPAPQHAGGRLVEVAAVAGAAAATASNGVMSGAAGGGSRRLADAFEEAAVEDAAVRRAAVGQYVTNPKAPVVAEMEETEVAVEDVAVEDVDMERSGSLKSDDEAAAPAVASAAWPGWLAALGIPRPVDAALLPAAFRDDGSGGGGSGESERGHDAAGARAREADVAPEYVEPHDMALRVVKGNPDSAEASLRKSPGAGGGSGDVSASGSFSPASSPGSRAVVTAAAAVAAPTATATSSATSGTRDHGASSSRVASPQAASGDAAPGSSASAAADAEVGFSTPVSLRLLSTDTRGAAAAAAAGGDFGPRPTAFTPVLGSLLDLAVGGSLFADTPPTSARRTHAQPRSHSHLQVDLGLDLDPGGHWPGGPALPSGITQNGEGEEGGGAVGAGGGDDVGDGTGRVVDSADGDVMQAFMPIASPEPVAAGLSPSRRRRLVGRGGGGAGRWGGDETGSSGGGASPGGLMVRVPGDVSSSTPFSSIASSGGSRFAAILHHTVTAALFGDSPVTSLEHGAETAFVMPWLPGAERTSSSWDRDRDHHLRPAVPPAVPLAAVAGTLREASMASIDPHEGVAAVATNNRETQAAAADAGGGGVPEFRGDGRWYTAGPLSPLTFDDRRKGSTEGQHAGTEGSGASTDGTTDPSSRGQEADRSNSSSTESVYDFGASAHPVLYSLDIEELLMLGASHQDATIGGDSVRSSGAAAAAAAATAALAAAAAARGMSIPEAAAAAAAAAASGSFEIEIDPVTGESGLVFMVDDPLEAMFLSGGGGGSSMPMGRRPQPSQPSQPSPPSPPPIQPLPPPQRPDGSGKVLDGREAAAATAPPGRRTGHPDEYMPALPAAAAAPHGSLLDFNTSVSLPPYSQSCLQPLGRQAPSMSVAYPGPLGQDPHQQRLRPAAAVATAEADKAWPGGDPEAAAEDVIVAMLKRKMDACMDKLRSLERDLRRSPPPPASR
ncbi:hypothetical protein VOLCADRAFT_97962 [Volvox carteri f. nagariensis]|uniref:Uncharacterized protein n=1 Tax=Volvox carteri f. nagariensis TaxID=3068 RepID=D8UE31_VOLCA|nr:uncharacterized protein VOLCADRAFT_97962 [Volvox carteri f. nagariensis]EFJ42053.1 hypothetical protein VOLCADRAFT_97962 [Volvox carteri f. nagariensis]|eukprot:XP_002956928.1 hypothetical protein VOLCADRAFT_97962 [Volvox carteri f. nagariensis]